MTLSFISGYIGSPERKGFGLDSAVLASPLQRRLRRIQKKLTYLKWILGGENYNINADNTPGTAKKAAPALQKPAQCRILKPNPEDTTKCYYPNPIFRFFGSNRALGRIDVSKKMQRCYKKIQIVNDLHGLNHQGSDEVGRVELIVYLFSRISMQNLEHPIASHCQRNLCTPLIVRLGLGHQLSFFL
ncbi:MAG: hypothetical protein A4E49_00274 [Methanosaeta sp. PtaU1.Bin112]|nr:MAG: hypothetical protein A4E49_00274 [Methanosaeta sp. PtaU1.Bin112]